MSVLASVAKAWHEAAGLPYRRAGGLSRNLLLWLRFNPGDMNLRVHCQDWCACPRLQTLFLIDDDGKRDADW